MRYVVCGLLMVFCAVSLPVFAHTPSSMELSADIENNKLNITIHHYTEKPRTHYINKVEIYVDDKEPIVKRFYFQKNRNLKRITMDIPDLQEAKKIVVKVYSRRGGSLEEELVLQSPEEEQADE